MTLTIHQKSIYLIIFNATMISRSVGKNIKAGKKVKDFKVRVFEKLNILTDKMDAGKLTEEDIMGSLNELCEEFQISFGQAQKPINVLLKYHFYLTKSNVSEAKKVLHCPIDSVILKQLGENRISLTKINKEKYIEIQRAIQKRIITARLEYDTKWDEQHLRDAGIL